MVYNVEAPAQCSARSLLCLLTVWAFPNGHALSVPHPMNPALWNGCIRSPAVSSLWATEDTQAARNVPCCQAHSEEAFPAI